MTLVAFNEAKAKLTQTETVVERPKLSNPLDVGYKVFDTVDGKTDDNLYADIDKTLKNIESSTIMPFLEGFYKGDSRDGIIELLDDEHDKKDGKKQITKEGKLNIIKSLIEYACLKGYHKDPGLCDVITQLNNYYADYSEGKYKDSQDFKNNAKRNSVGKATGTGLCAGLTGMAIGVKLGVIGGSWAGPIGWAIGAVAGAAVGLVVGLCKKTTDNEVIDKLIKQLYDGIKTKEKDSNIDSIA